MKINSINEILFQKRLIATCGYKKDNVSKQGAIYKLNYKDDSGYIKNAMKNSKWLQGIYIESIYYELLSSIRKNEIEAYSFEDENGEILGACSIQHYPNERTGVYLDYIEVRDDCVYDNKKRNKKFVGESMMAFLASLCKKDNISLMEIPCAVFSAYPFYRDKCGFRDFEGALIMNSVGFNRLIHKNKLHTGHKVEIIG